MKFDVDGNTVFASGALREGDDRPAVVFIHGAAMDHSVWVYHARYFRHAGRSVVGLDLPGHGGSAGPPLDSIEAMAAWTGRCFDTLGLEHVALAGHSMGALVALALAAADPRVEQLALLGAAVPMAVSDVLLDNAREDRQAARDMMMLWGHGSDAHLGGNAVAGIHVIKGSMRLLERARPGVLFNDLNACNEYGDGMTAAARVTARTRLVCGAGDRMTPMRAARELAAAIPNCDIDVLPACGHIMMSERPELTHQSLVRAFS